MEFMKHGDKCNCPHHGVIPVLAIAFGALFFMRALGLFSYEMVNITWPLLVAIGGMTMLGGKGCKCC